MASTSGTSTFNYNRDQIITSAARKLGAIASGETPTNSLVSDFSDQLNIMVKNWDATGLHIWTETEATLFLQSNQFSYTLGGTTNDHCALTYTATSISSGALDGATSIQVSSITEIGNTDFIGVTMDDGTLFWTTVNGAPSGSTVTLAAALPDTAAVGNPVYDYTTANAILRPLRIVGSRRYNFSSKIETPMILMSRLDYRNLPNKNNNGTPTQMFYDPRGGANNQGVAWVWPNPPDTTNAINFTWQRPLQDFDASSNIPDLPNEWLNAIIWNLAYQMAPEFDCTAQRYAMLKEMSQGSLDLAMGWDREAESYLFGFNTDQTGP